MKKIVLGMIVMLALVVAGCGGSGVVVTPHDDTNADGHHEDEADADHVDAVPEPADVVEVVPEVVVEPVVVETPVEDVPPAPPETNVKSFTVEAKQFEFVPSTITVNEGDTVKLAVTSSDVDHGIAIPTFGVREFLAPGNTVNIEFVADKKGTFDFFCSVACGSGHGGMRGKLVVE
tara:strand:- start:348 stop:875 length:528 start_codon:yes stop_codon:yes gene_type:complete